MKDNWVVFQLPDLLEKIDRSRVDFQEFLRTPSLACAIYHLPADSKDMQSAHEEDEVYYVLEGKAQLRMGEDRHPVQKGTMMYVQAACDHAFFQYRRRSYSVSILWYCGRAVVQHSFCKEMIYIISRCKLARPMFPGVTALLRGWRPSVYDRLLRDIKDKSVQLQGHDPLPLFPVGGGRHALIGAA